MILLVFSVCRPVYGMRVARYLRCFILIIEGKLQLFNKRSGQLIDIGQAPLSSQFSNVIAHLRKDSQTVVYFNTKDKAIQAAIDYAAHEQDKGDSALETLAKEIANQVHKDDFLAQLIKKGVAYHIGYLPASIRMKIEKLFREKKIVAMFCTNRYGGHMLLGVKDNGDVIGTNPEAVMKLKKNFVNTLNNPQRFSPTQFHALDEAEIDGNTKIQLKALSYPSSSCDAFHCFFR
jgi:hypothetical protein